MSDQSNTGSNSASDKLRVMQDIYNIGSTEGTGKVARIKLIEFLVAESKDGPLQVDDAGDVWKQMMQGSADAQKDVGGADPKDTAQRTSDIKHFIVLGLNKSLDGPAIIDNAKQRMKHLRASGAVKNARLWEMMLTFARAQNKSPEHPLTEAQIDKLFEDPEPRQRALADKVWGARNTLIKANEGEDRGDIYDVCTNLEKIVADLGGTTAQKKAARAVLKKAKDEAAAAGTINPLTGQPTKKKKKKASVSRSPII